MINRKLIPDKLLYHYPYMYKFLEVSAPEDQDGGKKMPYIAGNIPAIQNENARLATFFKCISRF